MILDKRFQVDRRPADGLGEIAQAGDPLIDQFEDRLQGLDDGF